MPQLIGFVFLFLGLLIPQSSFSKVDIMFEGYYKILSGNVHVGYVIQRFEFNDKKKQFIYTYYLETNALGGSLKESTKAISDNQFRPISYAYTSQQGSVTMTIDAHFKPQNKIHIMNAVIKKGVSVEKIQNLKLPPNTFLSSFLGYKLHQKKFKLGAKFKYSAIAEEDGKVYTGQSWIKGEENHLKIKSFKILNKFKGSQFISYVTKDAEVLATKSPLQQLETQLVKAPHIATKGFQINTKALQQLFGRVPVGAKNILRKNSSQKK